MVLRLLFCGLAALLSVGCSDLPERGAVVREIPRGTWEARQPINVVYENTDTLSRRELAVLVRFRSDFAGDRFDFVLETLTPDRQLTRDTLSVRPDRAETVSLSYLDTRTVYRSFALLDRPGEYRFTFMPLAPIEHVIGVGIEISD